MFNKKQPIFRSAIARHSAVLMLSALFILLTIAESNAQAYTRRNSPYSRYGLGDIFSTQFAPSIGTGGGLTATYNSVWDVSLSNPASLAHLQFTSFDMGAYYKHSGLSEKSTGQKATANDGNLNYFSLAFPITRSWEIEADTLRRAVPIQWGMGIALMPHSTVGYDVRITRTLTDIGDVEYKYAGEGTRFRANWANGFRYKGISVGANLGLVFGSVKDRNVISFLDSAYTYTYNGERILTEENMLGLLWDVGAQYDLYFTKNKKPDILEDKRLTFGAYVGGSNNMRILTKSEELRYGSNYSIDTIVETADTRSNMRLPLKFGGGVAFSKGLYWRFGANYEMQLWDKFSYSGISMGNSYTASAGVEFTPNYKDYTNYLNRIRYRFGGYYGKDPRIIGSGSNAYQLDKYGITFGLGLQLKPLKSTILGHTQVAFEFGYLGHKELIREYFFQVNLAFALTDSTWFRRAKFR